MSRILTYAPKLHNVADEKLQDALKKRWFKTTKGNFIQNILQSDIKKIDKMDITTFQIFRHNSITIFINQSPCIT